MATAGLRRPSPSSSAVRSCCAWSTATATVALTEARISLPRLHAGQVRVRDACNTHRFTTAIFGRRTGKTHFAVRRLWKRSTLIGSHYQGLWAAPTYDLTNVAWEEWHRLFPSGVYSSNKTEHSIRLLTGATLFFRSTDNPDALLGRGYDDVIVDEAARVTHDAIKRAILPTLADRNGRALAITTPAGKRNWVHEWYQRGLDETQAEWASVHAPSTENPNPSIQAWCHEMAPAEMGGGGGMPLDIYRQEILAEFLEDAASVFRNVRGCVTGEMQGWDQAKPDVIGIDVAKHQDFTVLTGMAERGGKRRVVAWDRFHRISWPMQMDRIKAAFEAAGRPAVLVDATGVGDKVLDDLRAMGVTAYPFKFTQETKQRLIQGLALDIEQGHVSYPEIPVLLGELEAYAYEISTSGSFRYNAPEGMHDDAVISLALANMAMKRKAASVWRWV